MFSKKTLYKLKQRAIVASVQRKNAKKITGFEGGNFFKVRGKHLSDPDSRKPEGRKVIAGRQQNGMANVATGDTVSSNIV